MTWFPHRLYSFVPFIFILSSHHMFQQESRLDKMWGHNNAGTVGFILIQTLKRDFTEYTSWSKCKTCLDQFQNSFFFIHWESAGIVGLIVWYLGWSCVTNHSTMCQASSWVAALLHAVTSYSVPFSVSGHCMFSSNICLNTLTWSVDHHRNSYASIWVYFVSSPSLVFPSVWNPLTGNVLLHFEESAETQKKHLSLLLDFSGGYSCLSFPSSLAKCEHTDWQWKLCNS